MNPSAIEKSKLYSESTEIGALPEGWEVVQIGSITKEHKQGFYTDENYSDDGINLVRITDLQNPGISYSSMPKIKIDENTFKQFKVEVGDFLIARSGAIGRYGIVENSIPCVFASYIIRFRFDKSRVDNLYFGKLFESFYISNELKKITQGATNKNINAQNIKKIKIPLPPLPEQRRIAEVLGTVDSAIQKVGGAIESTERLKRGLMQRLLAKGIGHERFKFSKELGCEIPEEWVVVTLNEILGLMSGLYFKFSEFSNEGIRCLKIDNVGFGKIAWDTITYLPESYLKEYSDLILTKSDIVVALNRPIIDGKVKVGMLTIDDSPSILYQRVGKIVFKDVSKLDKSYLLFFLTGSQFKEQLTHSLIGTDQPYIRTPIFLRIKLPLPPLSEQRRIAEILSAADRKLELERRRKEKLERVKKGLMNELLTGRKRVKIPGKMG